MKPLVTILACVLVLGWAVPARAELTLSEAPRKNFTWYGVLFLGLSLGSFAAAANDYKESNDALDKADASYKQYQGATTSSDADRYHRQTARYRRQAVGFESTGNAAAMLGLIFGVTGVACFFTNDRDTPILLSYNRVTVRMQF
jgi:hypothetical protein